MNKCKIVNNEPDCDECKNRRSVYKHDPSGDGHGGLNGGSWVHYPCPTCNPNGLFPQRDIAGNAVRYLR